jgi:hypothetical protein
VVRELEQASGALRSAWANVRPRGEESGSPARKRRVEAPGAPGHQQRKDGARS